MSTGRTYDEQRHSPLTKINDANVAQLGLAWHHELDAVNRGQPSTPIVVDGVMYVTTTWSKVFALDAKTGKLLWGYDPQVPGEWGVNASLDVVTAVRRVDGKVYLARWTADWSPSTPRRASAWDVLTIDKTQRYASTGAPRVANGKVFLGNAGAEMGVRGYISAYDARPASSSGGSTPCPAIRKTASRTRPWRWPRKPGRASGGSSVRRHGLGRDGLRPRDRPAVLRHRQRHAVEPQAALAGRRRQPVPELRRRREGRNRRVRVALPAHARR